MKKMMVILAAVAVVLGVAYAYAQGPGFGQGPGRGPGRCGDCGNYGKSAPLTEAQRTQLQELRSLWSDPNAKPEAIVAKEKELSSLEDQMHDAAVQQKLEARKILTPEQISQGGRGQGPGFFGGEGRRFRHGRGPGGKGPGGGPCF